MDQFLGLADWVLQLVLYVGIPLSVTGTVIYKFFETLKVDDGNINNKDGVGGFFKDVIKIFIVAVIGWVAIFLIRQVIPAAGESVVGGLGF